MSLEETRSVFEHLRDIGCCKRCSLRCLGERSHLSYRNTDDILIQNGLVDAKACENESPEPKVAKGNPCIACLGLLEEATIADTVEKVSKDVLSAQYDCASFTCALTLPICLLLRAHSLQLHLVDKYPQRYLPGDTCYVTPLKEAWKWTVAHRIAGAIGKELDSGAVCDFFVEIDMGYAGDVEDCNSLLAMHPAAYRDRAKQRRKYAGAVFSRKAVEASLAATAPLLFTAHFPSPPPAPDRPIGCGRVVCAHNSLFFAGRYNKFSRALSQTPWVIDGERRMESSVQEIVCDDIREAAKAEGLKFSSSGREDVDVRMLGHGRPFACELLNPRHVRFTRAEIRSLEEKINRNSEDVFVRDLQVIQKSQLSMLKTGEETKTKRYVALCVCRDADLSQPALDQLCGMRDVRLQQLTPIRVLHRRPQATRTRAIHEMRAHLLPARTANGSSVFKLHVQTQAGTYVKEFVHGDFGRTKPCLGELLGTEVDILALDVEEIELDWPPRVDYSIESDSALGETGSQLSSLDSKSSCVESKSVEVDSKFVKVDSKSVEVDSKFVKVDSTSANVEPKSVIDSKSVKVDSKSEEVDSTSVNVEPKSVIDWKSVEVDSKTTEVEPKSTEGDLESCKVESNSLETNFITLEA